ncbi:MAG TPA: serine hydrolase domain-containing protein [Phnomibacter sp.]|nr:serine hydrolase domain-containing protein [Phnomibacter sp.]
MYRYLYKVFLLILFTACQKNELPPASNSGSLYFPPIGSSTWETTTPESLGWNTTAIPALYNFLEGTNTRAFLVLKDGKIVLEAYFGKNLTGAFFNASSIWYWASAGKTLTAATVGIAQQEGYLQIDKPTSQYLGAGWSSLSPAQENQITVRHQLTMTSGLDDGVADPYCTLPSCLIFKATPGTRWAYHNGPYTLLDKVVANATHISFTNYFNSRLRDKIGMDGTWVPVDYNNVFYSTARSMARYGLLILNKGIWDGNPVIKDANYFTAMTNTSQTLNLSYGYLWWLNGKASFMLPGLQLVVPGSITPQAPADMVAAMGKNGQLLNVVPSHNLVVVRMGDDPDNSPVPYTYQKQIWEKLNAVIR